MEFVQTQLRTINGNWGQKPDAQKLLRSSRSHGKWMMQSKIYCSNAEIENYCCYDI